MAVRDEHWVLAPAGAGGDCIIVDVPPAPARLVERLRRLRLRPAGIVVTHAHSDHAGGVAELLEALGDAVPVYVHPGDREPGPPPRARRCAWPAFAPEVRPAPAAGAVVDFADGDEVSVGGLILRARHVPGRTAGSTCLMVEGAASPLMFTGDTLFAGGAGRCNLQAAPGRWRKRRCGPLLEALPAETIVLPGHGGITTVGTEREVSDPTLAA